LRHLHAEDAELFIRQKRKRVRVVLRFDHYLAYSAFSNIFFAVW
jgi:hypothetical protein